MPKIFRNTTLLKQAAAVWHVRVVSVEKKCWSFSSILKWEMSVALTATWHLNQSPHIGLNHSIWAYNLYLPNLCHKVGHFTNTKKVLKTELDQIWAISGGIQVPDFQVQSIQYLKKVLFGPLTFFQCYLL